MEIYLEIISDKCTSKIKLCYARRFMNGWSSCGFRDTK